MIDPELKAAYERIAHLERALSTISGLLPVGRPGRVMGRIEFRKVYSDVNCSPWKKIPDLFSDLFADLHEYLSYEYGEDPKLETRCLGDVSIYTDTFDLQYRGVVECETCEGGGWEYYGTGAGDPHFKVCETCFNPAGHLCP